MKGSKVKRACSFFFVFFASFLICLLVTGTYIKNKSQLEYAQMEHLASTKTNKVNNVISKLLYKTQALAALVIQNNGQISDFDRVAATILDDPAIRNVLVAPDGIVSHVYPLTGNEAVIGFNYFAEGAGNKEALLARETQELVLGGPFTLVQGGQALVGRLPVYVGENGSEKKFWGLVSVTLNYPQALAGAELDQLKDQGFAYEIWRISPDTGERQIISNSNYTYNKNARYVEQPMSMFHSEWYFRLSPIRNWYQYPETWIYSLAGFFISILIACLVLHNYDLKQMKQELEILTYQDSLTGILNRRGIFQYLEDLITKPDMKFTLCYIDLNKFKQINDTYGHNTGDHLLKQFANIFEKQLSHNHIFARIGGDEFVLIFKNIDDPKIVDAFFEKVYAEIKKKSLPHHMKDIQISFSIGTACYPRDGTNIDDLISIADCAMYKEKIGMKDE